MSGKKTPADLKHLCGNDCGHFIPRTSSGAPGSRVYHLADYDFDGRRVVCNFQIWEKGSSEPEHTHDCLELNFMVRGSGVNIINNRRYPAMTGDLYTIRRGGTHAFYTGSELEFYNLLFDFSLFTRTELNQLRRVDGFLRLFGDDEPGASGSVEKLSLSPVAAEAISQRFQQLALLRNSRNPSAALETKALFLLLLLQLCRCADELSSVDAVSPEYEHPALSRMLQYVHENYTKPISIGTLAQIAGLSEGYVGNFFRVHTGTTFGIYVRSLRIELARSLFDRNPNMKVEEAARFCGFENANYFSRVFRQITGGSPENYKNTVTPQITSPKK